jgi:glycosyltransferase involved in cell wall biosynthesis
VGEFDHVIVVSDQERARLAAGDRSVLVCPNGREPSAVLPDAPGATVAFVATMGWAPNVDAAVWLAREIWPAVLARVPGAQLLLVGKDPAPAVRALAGAGVHVTGTVADVAPYLAQSRVVVAPLRAGGGTRLKIMEALDVGRPVVATSLGCEGMEDLVGRGVIVADTSGGLAEAIAGLLLDPSRAAALGRAGHAAVAAEHTWDVALAPLLRAVQPC